MRLFYSEAADKFWQLQASIDDKTSVLVGNVAQPRRAFMLTPYSPIFLSTIVAFKHAGQPYQELDQMVGHGDIG